MLIYVNLYKLNEQSLMNFINNNIFKVTTPLDA